MQAMKRSAAIIKPKRPLMKWANAVYSELGLSQYPFKYFQENCSVILIPGYCFEREARAYINSRWEQIFEAELVRFCIDEPFWPRDRTKQLFWEWFGAGFHNSVYDPEQ